MKPPANHREAGSRQQAAGSRQRAAGSRQQAAGSRQRAGRLQAQSTWLTAHGGFLVILAEMVGAVALILGVGGRVMAVAIGAIMVGAALTVHLPNGFFMDWYGAQGGQGFEYHLLALALAAGVALKGSGAFSLDRVFSRNSRQSTFA